MARRGWRRRAKHVRCFDWSKLSICFQHFDWPKLSMRLSNVQLCSLCRGGEGGVDDTWDDGLPRRLVLGVTTYIVPAAVDLPRGGLEREIDDPT